MIYVTTCQMMSRVAVASQEHSSLVYGFFLVFCLELVVVDIGALSLGSGSVLLLCSRLRLGLALHGARPVSEIIDISSERAAALLERSCKCGNFAVVHIPLGDLARAGEFRLLCERVLAEID